jgi:hypothetical protein
MAVTGDFEAQSAVERELVLRLASLLWRLRRVTAIETGLFREQARQLLKSRGGLILAVYALEQSQQTIDERFKRIPSDQSAQTNRHLLGPRINMRHSQRFSLVYPTCRPIRLTGSAGSLAAGSPNSIHTAAPSRPLKKGARRELLTVIH